MKVLKKGDGRKGWSTKATCTGKGNGDGGCGAKLLIEEDDLFHTMNSDYTGDTDYFTTFRCVECTVLTDIKTPHRSQELPSWKTWGRSHGIEVKLRG